MPNNTQKKEKNKYINASKLYDMLFPYDEADGVDSTARAYFQSRLKTNRHSDYVDAFMYTFMAMNLPWYQKLWHKIIRFFKKHYDHTR